MLRKKSTKGWADSTRPDNHQRICLTEWEESGKTYHSRHRKDGNTFRTTRIATNQIGRVNHHNSRSLVSKRQLFSSCSVYNATSKDKATRWQKLSSRSQKHSTEGETSRLR